MNVLYVYGYFVVAIIFLLLGWILGRADLKQTRTYALSRDNLINGLLGVSLLQFQKVVGLSKQNMEMIADTLVPPKNKKEASQIIDHTFTDFSRELFIETLEKMLGVTINEKKPL